MRMHGAAQRVAQQQVHRSGGLLASPVSYEAGAQVMTGHALTYRCPVEDMQRIATGGITVARVTLGDETITYEVKKNAVPETAAKAACLLAEQVGLFPGLSVCGSGVVNWRSEDTEQSSFSR